MAKQHYDVTRGWKFRFDRFDAFIAFAAALALMLYELTMNKILDHGIAYEVDWFGGTPAIVFLYIALFTLFFLLFMLMVRAVLNKQGLVFRDILVGSIGLFTLVFLFSGFLAMMMGLNPVPVFTWSLSAHSFYKIFGVIPLMISLGYFVLTE